MINLFTSWYFSKHNSKFGVKKERIRIWSRAPDPDPWGQIISNPGGSGSGSGSGTLLLVLVKILARRIRIKNGLKVWSKINKSTKLQLITWNNGRNSWIKLHYLNGKQHVETGHLLVVTETEQIPFILPASIQDKTLYIQDPDPVICDPQYKIQTLKPPLNNREKFLWTQTHLLLSISQIFKFSFYGEFGNVERKT